MKLNVIGWYGIKNIGDNTFREVFLKQFWDHEIVFSQQPILDADAIILGGGGVVNGNYLLGLERYTRPLFAMGVDIAVNGMWWERIKSLPFKKLYVRSKEYTTLASETVTNIEYCPDLAFHLYDETRQRVASKRKCGIILSYELTSGIDHLATTLRKLQTEYDELVFITLYTEDNRDLEVVKKVAAECQCPCSFVEPDSPLAALQIMSELDLVISMRFHGIIFATMLGIPFLALANKGKCSLFCEQERLFGCHLEITEMNPAKLYDRIRWLAENQEAMSEYLLLISKENKQKVDQVLDAVKGWIY